MRVKIWARVGVSIIVDIDTVTEESVQEEVNKILEEHDPGKLHCHFDGEACIPEHCVKDASDKNDENYLFEERIDL